MNERRRFLQMLGGSVVAAGAGCDTTTTTTATTGSTTTSSSSGMGGAGTTTSTGSNCGVGGAANQGFNNDICQSDKGRFNVGTPADFTAMGLHKSKDVNSNVLIGRDAMGLYALSSLCTHQCCDMNTSQGNQQVGTISATGIRCNCHISYYDNYGKPINTNQPAKQTLASYGLSLGCDGSIYVDTTTTVASTTRLMA